MLTISKPLSAGQARRYHAEEFQNARENYCAEGERILDSAHELKERRNQVCRPHYVKPELLATQPNDLWSGDITKLLGPAKWTYCYLYVILDVFSRYVVGWMVAPRASASWRSA